MITTNASVKERRLRRKRRTRKKINGTPERCRLTIYRSLSHFYAQIIDDTAMRTLVAASSADKEIAQQIASATSKIERSKIVGELLAKRALAANVKSVVFDRNGYLYHGRVKAFAEAAREGGLLF
jgi:large subunit ribosomal protein L18